MKLDPELKPFIVYVLLMSFIMGTLVYAYTHPKFPKVEVTYDCRVLMGGWHPDVPAQVMDQCRRKMNKE